MFRDLDVVTLDFETYYDTKYSLRSKTYNTSEYVRDPEFKAQCVAIKHNDEPVLWYRDNDVRRALASVHWGRTALLCHNTAFDGFILSHHYGIVPAYYLDTLSMARALHSNSIGAGLDSVAQYYGLGNKLTNVLERTRGIRELPDDLMQALGVYCAVDVELTYAIFKKMAEQFPNSEFDLIDLTIKMFCQPVLEIDLPRVQIALDQELQERDATILKAQVPLEVLRSADQFAQALRDRGAEPPTKVSLRTKKEAWAFAKGDLAFQALLEHPEEPVRDLVKARLAAKSTIGETRAIRFLKAGADGQRLPVMLKYCGAHTTRWSAGNKMNLQNLVRGGELRKSILAPKGYVVMACDSSQIEARVLAWLADHHVMMHKFKAWDEGTGTDVYRLTAADCYNKPVDQIDKHERFVGKVATLGLGYGMGHDKYEYTLAAGLMGPPMIIPKERCKEIVKTFRKVNEHYPKLWSAMELMLYRLKERVVMNYKCLTTTKDKKIILPNGLYLNYPGLTATYDQVNEQYFDFKYYTLEEQDKQRRGEEVKGHKLYGGLLTENIVQALARVIVADQMLAIAENLRVVTMTHDEVVCIVKETEVEQAKTFMIETMRTPPKWCEDLPLNAEIDYGERYG